MRIALIFDKAREDTFGIYIERAMREAGLAFDHFWTSRAAQIPFGYDLYLRIDHGDYQADLPRRLRPRAFYVADTHLPKSWARIRRVAPSYDLVCCVHRQAAQRIPRAVWVPFACDPALHAPVPSPPRWDLAAVGTEGGTPRKFYLQALRERYPNSYLAGAPHTQIGAIYGQAKIGFNYSIRHEINMRMFEVLCGGALLLTNHVPTDDLAELGLVEGRHFVMYRSAGELLPLIERYLAQGAERAAIASAGRAQVLRQHTYRHRIQRIFTAVSEVLGIHVSIESTGIEPRP